jgi:cytochrome c553
LENPEIEEGNEMLLYAIILALGLAPDAVQAAEAADVAARQRAIRLLDEVEAQYGDLSRARAETLETIRDRTAGCALCHGADGNSKRPDVPNLAGENPAYLLQRLIRLQGGLNQPYVMHGVAKRYSPEEMTALALFYSGLERKPVEFDAALAERGAALYATRCQPCHGHDGRAPEGYASLAGQQPEYVVNTLVRFRDQQGWRDNPPMSSIARRLGTAQMQALAAYVASLPETRE